uniref:Cell wall protein DAN4-like n=1 Tax=Crassostrea virginica TaxID=6565 RepID=A0A8B8C606_CRAVI|nr:cell wall protein DAN4-like [Crassostrea virginica]
MSFLNFSKTKILQLEEILIDFLKQAPHKKGGPKSQKDLEQQSPYQTQNSEKTRLFNHKQFRKSTPATSTVQSSQETKSTPATSTVQSSEETKSTPTTSTVQSSEETKSTPASSTVQSSEGTTSTTSTVQSSEAAVETTKTGQEGGRAPTSVTRVNRTTTSTPTRSPPSGGSTYTIIVITASCVGVILAAALVFLLLRKKRGTATIHRLPSPLPVPHFSPIYTPPSPPLSIDSSTPLQTPSLFSSETSSKSDKSLFDVSTIPAQPMVPAAASKPHGQEPWSPIALGPTPTLQNEPMEVDDIQQEMNPLTMETEETLSTRPGPSQIGFEPVTVKMLPTESMRESTSTRTTSKLITTLMTTKRSLTSPRPIKRESTQMRSIKMGMTDKTTPSREMTSRPINRTAWCATIQVQVGRSDWPQGRPLVTLLLPHVPPGIPHGNLHT